jgi:hypothetical protein
LLLTRKEISLSRSKLPNETVMFCIETIVGYAGHKYIKWFV